MKKLLPAQRFALNFLLLKTGGADGYRLIGDGRTCGKQPINV
jgi:hypothetical protein